MIPREVESLQDQLTQGSLQAEEFFAIVLSTYEFDTSKEIYSTLPIIYTSNQTISDVYNCTVTFNIAQLH